MKPLPTAPAPGTPISSSLIRELIAAIRARTLLIGRGYRTRETPAGTTLEIDQPKVVPSAKVEQCFDLVFNAQDNLISFKNRYYSVGGVVYEASDESIEPQECFVILSISMQTAEPGGTITTCSSISDMNSQSSDGSFYAIPLYKIDDKGSVICDMRNMPAASAMEFEQ